MVHILVMMKKLKLSKNIDKWMKKVLSGLRPSEPLVALLGGGGGQQGVSRPFFIEY
jgi:hypothetical protein